MAERSENERIAALEQETTRLNLELARITGNAGVPPRLEPPFIGEEEREDLGTPLPIRLGTPLFGTETPDLPMVPAGSLLVKEPTIFSTWRERQPFCEVNAIRKRQLYSRGNNDRLEMTGQRAKTGTTYQYETGTFEVTVSATPVCFCGKRQECWGFIGIDVQVTIKLPNSTALGYCLLDGVDVQTPTTPIPGGTAPSPDVDVTLEEVDLPQRRSRLNNFRRPDVTKKEYVAQAFGAVPCTAGTHSKRFFITESDFAGKKNYDPGSPNAAVPTAFVDVVLTLTRAGGCKRDAAMKVYLLEFIPGYDFTHGGLCPGADAELPEVRPRRVGGGIARTRNIAKLIEEDGAKVDAAFVQKK